jgi:hypothetical protein
LGKARQGYFEMTGKPLAVTQKQVTAILKGAAKAGQ